MQGNNYWCIKYKKAINVSKEDAMTEKENHLKELRSRAMRLPLSPGVYIMHDK